MLKPLKIELKDIDLITSRWNNSKDIVMDALLEINGTYNTIVQDLFLTFSKTHDIELLWTHFLKFNRNWWQKILIRLFKTESFTFSNTQDIELLWTHFLKLMELATDSLPLVIILDGIAKVGEMCGRSLLQIVSNKLPSYVKVIVSIDEHCVQVRRV